MMDGRQRETSQEAYDSIVATGYLGRLQRKAYEVLFKNGPLSMVQMGNYETHKHHGYSLAKQFCVLERAGLIRVVGCRRNPQTNRRCNLYDVTRKVLNAPLPKPVNRGDQLAIKYLATQLRACSTEDEVRAMKLAAVQELNRRLHEATLAAALRN